MSNEQRIKVKKELNKRRCFKKRKNVNTFFEYVQEELKNTTIHGLPYILNSRMHFVERIFWIISFIGSVIFMAVLLTAQYTRFIKSPTVMSVEMNYFDWNISYPAITLCPLRKSDAALFQHLLKDTFDKTGLKTDSFFWSVVAGGMDNLDFIYLDISENVSSVLHPKSYAKLAAEMFRKFPQNSLTTNTNWAISLDTAMTEMGMCHVINSNVAVFDNPLKWHGANQQYARTSVELTIYEGDFLTQITNYTDHFKVYIHHPDELVLSTSPSITFDFQGFVTIGLSVWSTRISDEIQSMSISSRNCRFLNEPINKRYPVYSYNHCILECRIGIIKELCGCVPHFYKPLESERVCSINELKCVRKNKKDILSLNLPTSLTKRFWYFKKLTKSSRDCGCLSNCVTDIYHKDNENFRYEKFISQIQIGITSFPRIRVVRDIIFQTWDKLLRSGGVVNLFIGTSIISIIELLIIMAKLFGYFVLKCFGRFSD